MTWNGLKKINAIKANCLLNITWQTLVFNSAVSLSHHNFLGMVRFTKLDRTRYFISWSNESRKYRINMVNVQNKLLSTIRFSGNHHSTETFNSVHIISRSKQDFCHWNVMHNFQVQRFTLIRCDEKLTKLVGFFDVYDYYFNLKYGKKNAVVRCSKDFCRRSKR